MSLLSCMAFVLAAATSVRILIPAKSYILLGFTYIECPLDACGVMSGQINPPSIALVVLADKFANLGNMVTFKLGFSDSLRRSSWLKSSVIPPQSLFAEISNTASVGGSNPISFSVPVIVGGNS